MIPDLFTADQCLVSLQENIRPQEHIPVTKREDLAALRCAHSTS
jgi:hypothetical protein